MSRIACWDLEIASTLTTSYEDQAVCYFFTNYVIAMTSDDRGHFAFLPSMYSMATDLDPIGQAITCVGLAGLAYRRGVPELLITARQVYARALRLTNISLNDSKRAIGDEALATSILLGQYEVSHVKVANLICWRGLLMLQTINCNNSQALISWERHLNGAMRLLEIRGENQLAHKTGLELFWHLRVQVVR